MPEKLNCTPLPGAYVLVVDLARPLRFRIAGNRAIGLVPGRYAYCGSAHGPGGLAARLSRHVRPDKPIRWHIDHLTGSGTVAAIGVLADGRECALFDRVAGLPGTSIPVPGLGSSDCSRCAAHLAAVAPAFGPGMIGLPDLMAA